MSRAKRNIMLLSDHVPAERQLIELLDAIPAGNEAAFVRGLVVLGFRESQQAAAMLLLRGGWDGG